MLDWSQIIEQAWTLLDIFIAMILGGLIGFEREQSDKPAGLRTHMLIAGSACLFVYLGIYISEDMTFKTPDKALGIDPTRILHAIIVGISFIGGGTILKSQEDDTIRFLTTAATVLASGGIGIAVSLKLYVVAVGLTVLTLFISYALNKVT